MCSRITREHFRDDIHHLLRCRQGLHDIVASRSEIADFLEHLIGIVVAQDDHRNTYQPRIPVQLMQNADPVNFRHMNIKNDDIRMNGPNESQSRLAIHRH